MPVVAVGVGGQGHLAGWQQCFLFRMPPCSAMPPLLHIKQCTGTCKSREMARGPPESSLEVKRSERKGVGVEEGVQWGQRRGQCSPPPMPEWLSL